jgi:hypothetical protein
VSKIITNFAIEIRRKKGEVIKAPDQTTPP